VWYFGDDRIRSLWSDVVAPLSPHARYARALKEAGLDETALGRDWVSRADEAVAAPSGATLPFEASGTFDAARPEAVAWRFPARRGSRIEVEVELEASDARVFIDLFAQTEDGPRLRASAADGERSLRHEPDRNGVFILRIQPELLRGGRYTVRQRAVATLLFPVEGATARAVGSRFGDPRDGGSRDHQGVDIFAPRGTPVLAAADGWVTGATENRLGGKVVWVWNPASGEALYYAHLDRQEVSPGARVRAGDVIGRVGNTGNARGTPPHLHFGIYEPGQGAVDPLPFICDAPCDGRGMAYAR